MIGFMFSCIVFVVFFAMFGEMIVSILKSPVFHGLFIIAAAGVAFLYLQYNPDGSLAHCLQAVAVLSFLPLLLPKNKPTPKVA